MFKIKFSLLFSVEVFYKKVCSYKNIEIISPQSKNEKIPDKKNKTFSKNNSLIWSLEIKCVQ